MKSTRRLRKLSLGWVWLVLATGLWPAQDSPATPGGDNSGPEASQAQGEANALVSKRVPHQTDLFTGSFGYSIPIEGAPARNGTQPPLALVYSSSGENGWCGVGWNLDLGYIERNTKDGSPVKYSTATPPAPLNEGGAHDDASLLELNLARYAIFRTGDAEFALFDRTSYRSPSRRCSRSDPPCRRRRCRCSRWWGSSHRA